MNKKQSIILSLLIIIFLTGLIQLPTSQAAEYVTVTAITGSADQTTATFPITSNTWRLQWSYTPKSSSNPEFAFFSVFIYPKGETAGYAGSFSADGNTQTSGTEYVYEGNDDYYLKILAANLQSYTITIQQETQPTPAPTMQPTQRPAQQPTVQPTSEPDNSSSPFSPMLLAALIVVVLVVAVVAIFVVKRKDKALPLPPPP